MSQWMVSIRIFSFLCFLPFDCISLTLSQLIYQVWFILTPCILLFFSETEEPYEGPSLFTYGSKDVFGVFFYFLICVVVHAVIQEYGLDVSVLDLIPLYQTVDLSKWLITVTSLCFRLRNWTGECTSPRWSIASLMSLDSCWPSTRSLLSGEPTSSFRRTIWPVSATYGKAILMPRFHSSSSSTSSCKWVPSSVNFSTQCQILRNIMTSLSYFSWLTGSTAILNCTSKKWKRLV